MKQRLQLRLYSRSTDFELLYNKTN
jgi:hypothetical protein